MSAPHPNSTTTVTLAASGVVGSSDPGPASQRRPRATIVTLSRTNAMTRSRLEWLPARASRRCSATAGGSTAGQRVRLYRTRAPSIATEA